MKRKNKVPALVLGMASVLLLGSCAGLQTGQAERTGEYPRSEAAPLVAQQAEPPEEDSAASAAAETPAQGKQAYVRKGTGVFINTRAARPPAVQFIDGDISLNFEKTDIQEVVKVIIGDLLKHNYAIDPGVSGTVSVQTSRPVGRDALLPLLENLLRMNDAVLILEDGVYRVSPLADAARGKLLPSMGKPTGPGYRVQVIPLRYIAAREMEKILKPFIGEGSILTVDETRNLLILSGSSQELTSWLTTVDIFDVDWMKGYSVALYPLEHSDAKSLAKEMEKVLVADGREGLGEMIRIEPLERLNALLVITPQARYLQEAQAWIERFDQIGMEPGRRLFVYNVQNRKASDLATVIKAIFMGRVGEPATVEAAPGSPVVELKPVEKKEAGAEPEAEAAAAPAYTPGVSTMPGLALPEGAEVRIVADEQNNAILVMATAAEYRIIQAALKKLDIVPLQVLVEASVLEVTLSDELRYGLEWYFKNNDLVDSKRGEGLLDLDVEEGIGPAIPGFSYALVKGADDIRAVLNTLASDSKLNVLSSPSLMVLDNSQANIRVGEQVPVRISGERALGETTLYETFEYKDTGVMLSVTPRVNSGGLVTMEIDQATTDIGAVESTTQQRKFLQRNIKSEVAIQSGETIVLGGLILENDSNAESGVPLLRDIPVIGLLFGATEKVKRRTELLVLITPRVVRNQGDANAITREFRGRMEQMQQEMKSVPAPSNDAVEEAPEPQPAGEEQAAVQEG